MADTAEKEKTDEEKKEEKSAEEKARERVQKYFCHDSPKDGELQGAPLKVHLPYDVKKYHHGVINRDFLDREQYMNLLSTPRGYRWDLKSGRRLPVNWKLADLYCYREKESVMENDHPLVITDQRYIRDTWTDIWNQLSPEMIEKLKNFLMDDFKMTEEEATEFLEEERLRCLFSSGPGMDSGTGLVKRTSWVSRLAKIVARKASDGLLLTASRRSEPRSQALAKAIARRLGELTGEPCDPQDEDKSGFGRGEWFVAEGLGAWLSSILSKEVERTVCRVQWAKDIDLEVAKRAAQKEQERKEKEEKEKEKDKEKKK